MTKQTKHADGVLPTTDDLRSRLLEHEPYAEAIARRDQLRAELSELEGEARRLGDQIRTQGSHAALEAAADDLLKGNASPNPEGLQERLRAAQGGAEVHRRALAKLDGEIDALRREAAKPIIHDLEALHHRIVLERFGHERRLAELNRAEDEFHARLRAAAVANPFYRSQTPTLGRWGDQASGVAGRIREAHRAGAISPAELKQLVE